MPENSEKSPRKEFSFSKRKKKLLYALAVVGPALMFFGSDHSLRSFFFVTAIPMAALIAAISMAKTEET